MQKGFAFIINDCWKSAQLYITSNQQANCAFTGRFVMKRSVTVRFLIVFLTVVLLVLSGIAGESLYNGKEDLSRACTVNRIREWHLKSLIFGVHCFAWTRNLLEIRHPNNCSVYVAKKHGRKDLQQNICTFPDTRIRSIERTLKNCSGTDNLM